MGISKEITLIAFAIGVIICPVNKWGKLMATNDSQPIKKIVKPTADNSSIKGGEVRPVPTASVIQPFKTSKPKK